MDAWLADWSSVGERIEEMYARLSVATSVNTADKEAEERMNKFLDGIFPNVMAAEQKLKEKLLASQLEPKGFEIPLRNMRAEADLFRASNLPLLAEQQKLAIQYDKIYGAQTVQWEGEEVTLTRLAMNFQQPDRATAGKSLEAQGCAPTGGCGGHQRTVGKIHGCARQDRQECRQTLLP